MNAPLRMVKTPAEAGLAELFQQAKRSLPGDERVAHAREQAFLAFEKAGLPNRRVEEWKYTDLRALVREAKPLASPPSPDDVEAAGGFASALGGLDLRPLVFVNGAFAPSLSDIASLEPGLSIAPLSQALTGQGGDQLGRLSPLQPNVALALNAAFMSDGAVISIAEGARIKRPLHLRFIHVGGASAAFTRSLVSVGKGALVTLVESHEGPAGIDYQTNTTLELRIGDGAEVALERLQAEGDGALHLSTLMAEIGAHARLCTTTLTIGAAVSRHQVFAGFKGDHSDAMICGANLLSGGQHADTTVVVDHAKPHGTSREVFKTVLADQSRGVFQGKIIVRPEAQKTDGKMASHAVLLSETAEMDNKPELEIFADDVQCGHGATAGALDEELLFYLRARGIPHKEAEALLIQSFVGEALEAVQHDGVRQALTEVVASWLARRG